MTSIWKPFATSHLWSLIEIIFLSDAIWPKKSPKQNQLPVSPPFGSQERENSEIYFLFKFRGILCENGSYLLRLFHPLPFTQTIESFCAVVSIQNGSQYLSSICRIACEIFFVLLLFGSNFSLACTWWKYAAGFICYNS